HPIENGDARRVGRGEDFERAMTIFRGHRFESPLLYGSFEGESRCRFVFGKQDLHCCAPSTSVRSVGSRRASSACSARNASSIAGPPWSAAFSSSRAASAASDAANSDIAPRKV